MGKEVTRERLIKFGFLSPAPPPKPKLVTESKRQLGQQDAKVVVSRAMDLKLQLEGLSVFSGEDHNVVSATLLYPIDD
jgi:hypothetical protein